LGAAFFGRAKFGDKKTALFYENRTAFLISKILSVLSDFSDCDSLLITDFDTALTSKAFFSVHGYGFAVLHLINVHRANLYTFFTSFTLAVVNGYFITHESSLL
jgi:hypothetical protein